MKKIIKTVVWVAVAIFVAYTFYFLWQQSQPTPEVYELITPKTRDISETTVATGQLVARKQVAVKPQITGIISELLVNPGDYVEAGQVIARIKVIPDMTQLNNAQTNIESARIKLTEDQREYDRAKRLYDKGVISTEELQQKETTLKSAKENLAAAQAQLEVVTKGSSSRSGTINTTVITTSMAGTVLSVPVKVGASVSGTSSFSDGTTICTIADMKDVVFQGNIDETEVLNISVGMPTKLVLGAMQDVSIPATLEYISPEGIQENGVTKYQIRAAAHIASNIKVRSGFSVNAQITTKTCRDVLSVDETAVSFENDSTFVYTLTSDPKDTEHQQWKRTPVTVGIGDGIYVQITKGITANMKLRGTKK